MSLIAIESKEERMQMELHNQLDSNFDRALNTVSYIADSHLSKFKRADDWKVDVWLDQEDVRSRPEFTCGVSLKRPNQEVIFTKKNSDSLNDAVKTSFETIKKTLIRRSA